MLPKQVLFTAYALSVGIISIAQKVPTVDRSKTTTSTTVDAKSIEQLPFSRNFNEFTIRENLSYQHTKPDEGDSHTNTFNLNIDYNRFVIDHLALGVQLDLSTSKYESGNTFSKSTNWMLYGDVMYGTTFNSNFNLYGKVSVGFGTDKFSATNTTSPKENQFGYKLEIGSPIHMFDDGGNYITPYIGYNYLQQKNSFGKTSDNEFSLGLKFQNYAPCGAYQCDCHHARTFSRGTYDAGRSFIGYSSWGNIDFGKSKFDYNNFNSENDIFDGSLSLEYGYYFIPNLAIGAGIDWSSQTNGSGNSKTTNSLFRLMPMITGNLPTDDCWNNLFLQAGYGFGFEKSSSGTNDQKTNITNYGVYVGFNDYFGKHLAFTPKIGYDWETFKNPTTDVKSKFSGFELGLGCSLHF